MHLDVESAQNVAWPVIVPDHVRSNHWTIAAKTAAASDSVTVLQKIVATIPVTVQQATLAQVERSFTLPVAAPADALADADGALRGGLSIALKPKLSDALPGVVDWFNRYPYNYLKEKASIAIGTLDEQRWDDVVRQLPLYLDQDALGAYYPPHAGDPASGSDVLTAYLSSASTEASALGKYGIPVAMCTKMQGGPIALVEGRLKRDVWTPFSSDTQRQLDVRKLAAIDALARDGKATPRMLQSSQILPNQWPTSAVIDWTTILKRISAIHDRDKRLAEADQIMRARLN